VRVLLVSYHLYPDGTAEGLCVAKTARALCDAGHEVTVITRSKSGSPDSADAAELRFLSGIRVSWVAPDEALVPGWAASFYRISLAAAGGSWVGTHVIGRASAVPNLVLGCSREEHAWVAAAANQIVQVWNHAEPRFDVIHSRLNHSVSHVSVLAALPHLSPPVPWCAHFSDPWPHHLYPPPYQSKVGPLSRVRLEGILARILARAGSLTFPGERLMRFLLSGNREVHRAKAHVVPHLGNTGMTLQPALEDEKFSILFAGFLLKQRDPSTFLQGLRQFLDKHPGERQRLNVRFVGRGIPAFSDLASRYGLQDVVDMGSRVSFDETWQLISRSHVLLLIESVMEEGIFMPSKLADYLSSGRIILALSPSNGTVADYLAQGGGIRVDPDSPDQVEQALSDLYSRWQANRLDELRPAPPLLRRISPVGVVPGYEAAFRQAIEMAASKGGTRNSAEVPATAWE
jgi:glycosyltransferase involved in cell wall biosynthesis